VGTLGAGSGAGGADPMKFLVTATPSADADLGYYKAFEQRVIVDAIKIHLAIDAHVETNRRKRLTQHPLASWELRVGKYRVFYELEDQTTVKIVAVGHKEHNELFVRGKRVEL
jgi:mRNA-degrading endonuclease RelE of RelBE toxin-antitoxin system